MGALLGVGHQGIQLTGREGHTGRARRAVVGAPQLVLKVAVYVAVLLVLVHVHIHAVSAGGGGELEDALARALREGGLDLRQGEHGGVAHVGRLGQDLGGGGALHVGQVEDGLRHLVQGEVAHLLREGGHGGAGGAARAPLAHGDGLQEEGLVGHAVFFRGGAFFVLCRRIRLRDKERKSINFTYKLTPPLQPPSQWLLQENVPDHHRRCGWCTPRYHNHQTKTPQK